MTDVSHVAICKGVKVPPSPFLTETRIRRISEAAYEGEEIAGALAVVRRGDRVLEMGAGLGIVGAVTARNAEPAAVLAYEANPDLIPHIRELHRLNGLEEVIELRNRVLISAPDRPDTMTFHLGASYLGSSLLDNDRRRTTPIEVQTDAFDSVARAFRPDVLIMDIEGGELEFLTHADLSGIRAVVIEFHPGVYGRKGVAACKTILRDAGFRKVEDKSSRFVWACTRQTVDFVPPLPEGGWSAGIEVVDEAVVVPPGERALVQRSGVLRPDGTPVPHAALWRGRRLLTPAPAMPPADMPERLPGTWLWGGVLWRYFPHFITESITRLWADAARDGNLAGILFVPRNPKVHDPVPQVARSFLSLMGCDLPIREAHGPLRVERLIVPGQGFGLGDMAAGTPAFRHAVREHFARDVAPEGPDRLYISRSALGPKRGALLGEPRIESYLAEQGYEIFHPQAHSLEVQIARYRAARRIVAAEGSALHLFAFAGGPETRVAMILRRRSGATDQIARHVESFTGAAPVPIDTLARRWRRVDTPRERLHIGEPDFAALQAALQETGFIDGGPVWQQPDPSEVAASLGSRYCLAG